MSDEPEITEPEAPEFPFDWMPLDVGNVEIVNWDGHSYVDRTGRTYWSGQEPSADDAADAVTTPRSVPPEVPQVISRSQFVIAARRVLGITEGDIFALISQLASGEVQETARDLWENAREFKRDNSMLAALATLNGNTAAQIDEVFRVGGALDLD